jgi:hypothetical protein
VQVAGLQSVVAVDYGNKRATIFPAFGGGYLDVDVTQVDWLFDISKLSTSGALCQFRFLRRR